MSKTAAECAADVMVKMADDIARRDATIAALTAHVERLEKALEDSRDTRHHADYCCCAKCEGITAALSAGNGEGGK